MLLVARREATIASDADAGSDRLTNYEKDSSIHSRIPQTCAFHISKMAPGIEYLLRFLRTEEIPLHLDPPLARILKTRLG
jgi:hypothetical protein